MDKKQGVCLLTTIVEITAPALRPKIESYTKIYLKTWIG